MDEEMEQVVREVLAGEQFGVLVTKSDDRLHTSTVLFAETPPGEMVFAIRPPTLKAQMSYASPGAAFHVDNRAVTAIDRTRFTRIGLEGALRLVERTDPSWQRYHDVYAAKHPFGGELFRTREVEVHVLTPWTMRVAVGADPAVDVPMPLRTRAGE